MLWLLLTALLLLLLPPSADAGRLLSVLSVPKARMQDGAAMVREAVPLCS
jgi:hypothetical protein